MPQALSALQSMITCKADKTDFAGLYAATERGSCLYMWCFLLTYIVSARNFEQFQAQADAKLAEVCAAFCFVPWLEHLVVA